MSAKVFSEAMGLIGEKYIMEAVSYQGKKRSTVKIWLNRVAGILLAILLAGSAILTFSTEARAAFFGWVRQQVESFYGYFFVGEPVATDPVRYELTEIPEGFTFESLLQIESGEIFVYSDEDGNIAVFSYAINPTESNGIYLEAVPCEHRSVTVNGMPGDLYLPADGSVRCELVWIDEETRTLFSVGFPVDGDALIEIAESVSVVE